MSFHADDLRLRGVDADTVSSSEAWWRVAVVGGDHAPGRLLVRDDARRDAGLSGGATADDARFRSLVADALNHMMHDLGEDALIGALRDSDELRLGRLTFPPTRDLHTLD